MSVSFRPLPALTIVCTILLAALISLGVWQLQRLQWKLALIDLIHRNMNAPPVRLGDGGHLVWEPETNYLHVTTTGRFDNSREAYVFAIGPEGSPVYHVIVPFRAHDGETYLVDRGFVPRDMKSRATRPAGISDTEQTIKGYWRWQDAPGAFTPKPDLVKRIWYYKDVAGIARADGIKLWEPPGLIEADATPNPGGWPRGGQTQINIHNDHLQYAITWFLMAAGLVGVYLAYHVSQGRLTFGKRRER